MKNTLATLIAIIIAVASLHAFRAMQHASVTGSIQPSYGAQSIWAIQGKDTTKVYSENGAFTCSLKPGTWKLRIAARSPLKDRDVEVLVQDRQTTDIGVITLHQ
ncbi:MAG: hypothetical protein J7578_19980 [Chitinophagaceae bacterium]|nr:hypothetical protein [Chitinophagaceae bacterium]